MSLVALLGLVGAVVGTPFSGLGAQPLPHANSFSISEVHVRAERIELQLRCQVLSLGEVIPAFDPELDGHAADGEIAAHAEAIADYITDHFRFVPNAANAGEARDATRALERIEFLVVEAPLALDPLNEVSEWVDVRLRFKAADALFDRLGVHVELFEITSPGHRDSAAVVWNGVELGAWQFAVGASEHVFLATDEVIARGAPVIGRYARKGPRALLSGFDALLLALLFVLAAGPSRRSALVTSGIYLAAIAAGVFLAPRIDLKPQHVRFLQLTVPLSLAYVALDDLLHREGRTRIIEPLVFGVVVGAREAVALAPELGREEAASPALLGFALGHVATLLAVVLGALVLVAPRGPRHPAGSTEREAFAPRPARLALGGVSLAVGAALFAWRTFGSA